ncbi:hypothetical protein Tco_0808872 [Tanacetum coccineum]
MAGVDVNTLTMEQYLALSRENQAPGVVKPKIGGNVNFEIKSQFMRELREDTFSGNKDENAHNHIDRAFIQRYCPPSMTVKQLEDIHNFKQEGDESLYQAWERTMNRQLLDLHGPIPGMRPAEALTAIQTMVGHSQKWHDDTTSRNIGSSSSKDGLAALVRCQICEGPHLDKDCPLIEEVKQVEDVRYGEFGRTTPFNRSNGGKFRVGPPGYYTKIDNRPPYAERRQSLEELLAKHQEEFARISTEMEVWIKKLKENVKINTRNQDASLKNLETQIKQLTEELRSKRTNLKKQM